MIRRIARIIAFPVGILIMAPGLIQWVLMGRNIGMQLLEWSCTD